MKKSSLLGTALVFGLAGTGTAFAQVTPSDDQSARSQNEIVVTARRTEESLQDVPGAVSAFSEETLKRMDATDPTGLQGAVPNLNLVQGRGSSNATNIYIRGVGQPDALQTFDPAIGFYVDDVYYSRIRGTQLDLFDVERIEVLRGPQGTLYGKNTIGGAVRVITKRPSQDPHGMFQVTVGDYGLMEARIAGSGPVSDTLAIGGALFRATRDGYVTNPVNGEEYNDRNAWAGRVQIVWNPTNRFNLYLAADYAEEDNAMVLGQPTNTLFNFSGVPIFVPPTPLPKYDFTGQRSAWLDNSTTLTHWGVSASASFELSDTWTLKSITAYRNLHNIDNVEVDSTPLEVFDAVLDVKQNQWSQEFQAIMETDRWTVVGGLYYLRENITSYQQANADDLVRGFFLPSFPPFIPPNAPATFFHRDTNEALETTSWASFINATFAVTDRLKVTAGVRYNEETKDYLFQTVALSDNILLTVPNTLDDKKTWKNTSPMVSVDYHFTDDLMIYGRAAQGFKSGGFNGRALSVQANAPYEPETMTSYEFGIRSAWPEHGLRVNATAFYNDYQDFQARVQDTAATIPPQILLTVLNAGHLKIYGGELEVSYAPTKSLLLDTQVGYLHAEYGEFEDERFTSFGGSRAFQTPAFSPEWTARFGASYGWDLGSLGEIRLNGSARFRSRMALAVDNTLVNSDVELTNLFQGDYWLFDASLVWTSESGRFSAGVYGRNLADEIYRTDAQEFSNIGNTRTVYYGDPRTVRFVVSVRY
jgi:iron complex outermembrane receptor protein